MKTSSANTFRNMGWDVSGGTAYAHFEAAGVGIQIDAAGEVMVQVRDNNGKWRWNNLGAHGTPEMAACAASDWFYGITGWELLSWRGA